MLLTQQTQSCYRSQRVYETGKQQCLKAVQRDTSRYMQGNQLIRSYHLDRVGYTSEETYPASTKLVEATKKWGASGSAVETAYNIAFDTHLPMFEHMAQSPERVERFANVMVEMTSTDGYNIRHLVNGFDWEALEDGTTVVDVGHL